MKIWLKKRYDKVSAWHSEWKNTQSTAYHHRVYNTGEYHWTFQKQYWKFDENGTISFNFHYDLLYWDTVKKKKIVGWIQENILIHVDLINYKRTDNLIHLYLTLEQAFPKAFPWFAKHIMSVNILQRKMPWSH